MTHGRRRVKNLSMMSRRELADAVFKIMVDDLKGQSTDKDILWAIARTDDDSLLRFYSERQATSDVKNF